MKPTLDIIKEIVDSIADKIKAPKRLLPTYGNWREGHPNVEVDKNGQLYYEIYERGQKIKNDFAVDENDLCYRLFYDITFSMAAEHELDNSNREQDFRRLIFSKQTELLGQISEDWKLRTQRNHDYLLRINPFDDDSIIRATYSKQLSDTGIPPNQAWDEACKKYPLPNHS